MDFSGMANDILIALVVVFLLGVTAAVGSWALWHFVLSHIAISWA